MFAPSDQLRIALCPSEVAYVRFARGLRMRPVAKGIVGIPHPGPDVSWRRATDALRTIASKLNARPAEVRVVLSNCFVRYALVPWQPGARAAWNREPQLRQCFRQLYGEAADAWHIQESPARDGVGTLACATERELLDELCAIFDRPPLRLASVQPLLVAAFNQFRNALGNEGCFFLYEPGKLCGGIYAGGEWRSLHATNLPQGASIAAAIEREVGASRIAGSGGAFLCVTGTAGDVPAGLPAGARWTMLQPPQRAGAAYGMALFGSQR